MLSEGGEVMAEVPLVLAKWRDSGGSHERQGGR